MSKPQSVVGTERKYNKSQHVVMTNRKGINAMKNKTTDENVVEVEGSAKVVVNSRVAGKFSLKFKKLVVTISLGLVAYVCAYTYAASLP